MLELLFYRYIPVLVMTCLFVMIPMEMEYGTPTVAISFPYKGKRIHPRDICIRLRKTGSSHQNRNWYRQQALRCDDIQYRLRAIWTIPRHFQGITF
ncbi:hypothetical protein JOD24_003086 [Kroppenstedtia sanguinis]